MLFCPPCVVLCVMSRGRGAQTNALARDSCTTSFEQTTRLNKTCWIVILLAAWTPVIAAQVMIALQFGDWCQPWGGTIMLCLLESPTVVCNGNVEGLFLISNVQMPILARAGGEPSAGSLVVFLGDVMWFEPENHQHLSLAFMTSARQFQGKGFDTAYVAHMTSAGDCGHHFHIHCIMKLG